MDVEYTWLGRPYISYSNKECRALEDSEEEELNNSGCVVHGRMENAARRLRDLGGQNHLFQRIDYYMGVCETANGGEPCEVVFTGHSVGGGIAMMMNVMYEQYRQQEDGSDYAGPSARVLSFGGMASVKFLPNLESTLLWLPSNRNKNTWIVANHASKRALANSFPKANYPKTTPMPLSVASPLPPTWPN